MKASIYEMIKEIFNNLETNNLAVVGEPEIPVDTSGSYSWGRGPEGQGSLLLFTH